MSTIRHIIAKDLRHFRWTIVLWLACYAYIFLFHAKSSVHPNVNLLNYFWLTSLLSVVVISLALLIGIIQQDHPTDTRAFWRTRPITPGRLLTAKLVLLFGLFVLIPLATVVVGGWMKEGLVRLQTLREYWLVILVLSSVVLSLAAAASCTRKVPYAFLLWVSVVFASGTSADLLSRFMPKLSMQLSMEMNMTRVLSLLVFSALVSLVVILNQYLRRRLSTSIVLLVFGAIGSALMGVLWSYYYFYQG